MPGKSDNNLMEGHPPDRSATAEAAAPLGVDEFQTLLEESLPAAYGYALRLTRNRADAEDLVQDAALRAFRAVTTFEPEMNFKAWIFRILTRCFWANHRRRQRRPSTVDFDDAPDLYLFARSAEQGLRLHEIADVLEVPVGTVRSRLHRGRKMLQKALRHLAEESGIVNELTPREGNA
jgi:RNA polymerase sigma-70 factor (ECF subfamily)